MSIVFLFPAKISRTKNPSLGEDKKNFSGKTGFKNRPPHIFLMCGPAVSEPSAVYHKDGYMGTHWRWPGLNVPIIPSVTFRCQVFSHVVFIQGKCRNVLFLCIQQGWRALVYSARLKGISEHVAMNVFFTYLFPWMYKLGKHMTCLLSYSRWWFWRICCYL